MRPSNIGYSRGSEEQGELVARKRLLQGVLATFGSLTLAFAGVVSCGVISAEREERQLQPVVDCTKKSLGEPPVSAEPSGVIIYDNANDCYLKEFGHTPNADTLTAVVQITLDQMSSDD